MNTGDRGARGEEGPQFGELPSDFSLATHEMAISEAEDATRLPLGFLQLSSRWDEASLCKAMGAAALSWLALVCTGSFELLADVSA